MLVEVSLMKVTLNSIIPCMHMAEIFFESNLIKIGALSNNKSTYVESQTVAKGESMGVAKLHLPTVKNIFKQVVATHSVNITNHQSYTNFAWGDQECIIPHLTFPSPRQPLLGRVNATFISQSAPSILKFLRASVVHDVRFVFLPTRMAIESTDELCLSRFFITNPDTPRLPSTKFNKSNMEMVFKASLLSRTVTINVCNKGLVINFADKDCEINFFVDEWREK